MLLFFNTVKPRLAGNNVPSHFSTSHTNAPHSLSLPKAGTHSPFGERWHTAAYTPKHRASLLSLHGGLSLISHLGKQKPEEADARLRRVSASSGVAALPGCVTLFVIWKCCCFVLCAQGILRVRGWGGITTLDVFRTQSKRPVPACPNDSFAVFRGRAAIIDSSAAKYVPFPAGTGLSHPNSPGSLLRKGTGAVFLHHFRERAKNVAICALVQVAFGSNLPPPTPVVMPFSTAHATACA